jgi:hypothetical protein
MRPTLSATSAWLPRLGHIRALRGYLEAVQSSRDSDKDVVVSRRGSFWKTCGDWGWLAFTSQWPESTYRKISYNGGKRCRADGNVEYSLSR